VPDRNTARASRDTRPALLLLLLLAALANPVIGTPRPLESLRLVVAIQWLSEDEAAPESPVADRPAVALDPSASPMSPFGAPHTQARSTALPRSSFQRPPPRASLHS
jgi:hypothetical protein